MVKLFKRDQSVISRHITNIFREKELDKKSNMHFLHIANSDKPLTTFGLDIVISVGYRIKSREGTQFRIWANKILKQHLVQGYSINEKRLKEQTNQLNSLKNTINLLSCILEKKSLNNDEATGLLKVVSDYSYALDILNKYDHQQLTIEGTTVKELFIINYAEANQAIRDLKDKLI